MSRPIWVRGVGVWTPESPTLGQFLAGERMETPARPASRLLPARMRGRASLLTAMLADVVEQATRSAGVDPSGLPSVFGSAYGEMQTTLRLLQQLWAADGALSPAKFQASVHNTAAAQLSIALGNASFSSSLAAGHDTLAMALLEAGAFLERHPGQMLVACGDEGACQALQPGLAYAPLAAAFVLDNLDAQSSARLARIRVVRASERGAIPERWRDNPVQPALALAAAVLSGERVSVPVNEGAALGFVVEVESMSSTSSLTRGTTA